MKTQFSANLSHMSEQVFRYNDFLADNPELPSAEFESSRRAAQLLEEGGFEVEYPYCGLATAFNAVKRGAAPGPKVGLLVEYDALPDIGHACGHCASGSMSILAGLALASLDPLWAGELRVIGTPDEELNGGKIVMADCGVFDDLDLAIMVHIAPSTEIWPQMLTLSNFFMEFTGTESHAAAAPSKGRSALSGALLTGHAVDLMRQHFPPGINVHGIVRDGGRALNIIPGTASLDYDVRGTDAQSVMDIEAWMQEAAEGCAAATRTKVEVSHPGPTLWGLKPNEAAKAIVAEAFAEAGVRESGPDIALFAASSDIGHVALRCPTAHPMLGGLGADRVLHTLKLAEAMKSPECHRLIVSGAAILGFAALQLLREPSAVSAGILAAEALKRDFNAL